MNDVSLESRLLGITSLAAGYCSLLENARNTDRQDFLTEVLGYLPRLYYEFGDLEYTGLGSPLDFTYFPEYVDEDFYDSVRRNVESVLGPDDTFLETFEEDMKYSDTPIAASISESLADIFQPLYNFISVVKESEGEQTLAAYGECRENFVAYWSQTLCNVMRALNHVRYNTDSQP